MSHHRISPDQIAKERILLGALKYRNFRLFFFGQSISLIGTWMQQVAMIWLVYRLSGSAFLLGLVGFFSQIPSFFLAPVAGVYSDRWNLHRTILTTQSLAMCQAAILAVLTLTGTVAVWHVLALSVCLGLITAFDVPARQAFLIQMVEGREGLTNAIGLNSSMFNGARLVGPAIAGFLIAAVGEGVCFLLNALSYVAVLAALLAMRLPPQAPAKPSQHVLHELSEGFRYAFGFLPIREILMLLALVNMAAMPLTVLLPVFAKIVLHGGSDTLGLLTAAIGVGSTAGSPVPGLPQERARPGAADCLGQCPVRPEPDRLFVLPCSVAFDAAPGDMRLCRDDGNGGQQHHPANHRGRRQTRPGDELLRDGFPGRGSVGKPVGRQYGQSPWGGPRRATRRNHVYHGFVGFRLAFACHAEDRPADLSADWDSAGRDIRDSVRGGSHPA